MDVQAPLWSTVLLYSEQWQQTLKWVKSSVDRYDILTDDNVLYSQGIQHPNSKDSIRPDRHFSPGDMYQEVWPSS